MHNSVLSKNFIYAAASLLSFFILSIGSISVLAQSYSPPAGSPLAEKIHPRLFLTVEKLPVLRQRILTHCSSEFQKYVQILDSHFDDDVSPKLANFLFMGCKNYAFLYLLDPAQMSSIQFSHTREQYGRKAIEHAMVAKDTERGDSHSSASFESDDGTYHSLALGIAYDWVFPLLSLTEKQDLADGMINLYDIRDTDADVGEKPKLSNKVSGYIHGGSVGALALWGDELGQSYQDKAQEMLEYFNAVFLQRVLETGDRIFEGPGWGEGASYYFLGMTNISFLAGAASSALGQNLLYSTDFLRRNVLYILYNTLPLKLRNNYYMSRHDTNSLQEVVTSNMSRLIGISAGALRDDDPDMAGFAKWLLTARGLGLDVEEFSHYDARLDDLFFRFIWGYKDVTPRSITALNVPRSAKLGLGQIVMKSNFHRENSTHVIFWAPQYWYSPHANFDLASFTIYKNGSLALDSGNGKNSDDFPRGDKSKEAVFHNIMGLYDPDADDDGFNYMGFDFDSEGASDHWQDPAYSQTGVNLIGQLRGFITTPDYDYAEYDYSHAYNQTRCRSAVRRMMYLRGKENKEFVLIHDLVDSDQEKRFLLHTAFEPTINNDIVTVTNNFENAHGRMFVKSILPENKEILKVGGEGKWFVDANWQVINSRGPYVDWGAYWTGSYRFEIRSQENEFLTLMQLGDSEALTSLWPMKKIVTTNFSGVFLKNKWLVLLKRSSTTAATISYKIKSSKVISHIIAGLEPHTEFMIYKNKIFQSSVNANDVGVVFFKDNPAGITKYKIIPVQGLSKRTGIEKAPVNFKLDQNYPNPFQLSQTAQPLQHDQTTIQFQLAQAGQVRLQIFDMTGRLVNTLIQGRQNAGLHQVAWNGLGHNNQLVPAGVYFYRLHTDEFIATRKLTLLR